MEEKQLFAGAVLLVVLTIVGCFLWFGIGWFILWGVDHLGYADQIDETVFKTVWLALFASMSLRVCIDSVKVVLKDD